MIIRIPYTKYSFSPPKEISPELINTMKSTSKNSFRNFIEELIKEEQRQFISKHPTIHNICITSVSVLVVLSFFGLLAILLYFFGAERLIDKIISYDFIQMTFIGLFLVSFFSSFLWLRSYIETYSSFKKYLRKKKRFYLKQKKNVDMEKTI